MAVPLVTEMDFILKLWLGNNVPLQSVLFCKLILLVQLIFQLSSGVALTIDAVGKIKEYRLVLSSVLILNLPLSYIFLKLNFPPYVVFIVMISVEVLCLLVRLFYAKKMVLFPIIDYFRYCLFPLIISVCICFSTCYLLTAFLHSGFLRLVINGLLSTFVLLYCSYNLVLSKKEKIVLKSFLVTFVNKFRI